LCIKLNVFFSRPLVQHLWSDWKSHRLASLHAESGMVVHDAAQQLQDFVEEFHHCSVIIAAVAEKLLLNDS